MRMNYQIRAVFTPAIDVDPGLRCSEFEADGDFSGR